MFQLDRQKTPGNVPSYVVLICRSGAQWRTHKYAQRDKELVTSHENYKKEGQGTAQTEEPRMDWLHQDDVCR
uniref:Uncharacterized protein n=1 Tax=Steinernema glaseri TaxID=37863 RepID=A0A1I7ZIK6_9BILA